MTGAVLVTLLVAALGFAGVVFARRGLQALKHEGGRFKGVAFLAIGAVLVAPSTVVLIDVTIGLTRGAHAG